MLITDHKTILKQKRKITFKHLFLDNQYMISKSKMWFSYYFHVYLYHSQVK